MYLLSIFDPNRNACERWQRFTFGGHAVDPIDLFQRTLFRKSEVRADLSIFFLYARVVGLSKSERRRRALLDGRAGSVDGELSQFHCRDEGNPEVAIIFRSLWALEKMFHPHPARSQERLPA